MRRNNILTAAFLGAMTLSSCGDFLEETSQDEFTPETISSYQEVMNGEGYAMATTIDPLTHLLTDDFQGVTINSYYQSTFYTEANVAYKEIYTWQPNMGQVMEDKQLSSIYKSYQDIYELIMTCNLVIEGCGEAEGTQDEYNQTVGEALAMRAYYYWYLVNLYAMPYNMEGTTPDQLTGVPLITSSEIRDEGPTRASVKAVYDQITADIERACTLLETQKENTVSKFRVNSTAAHLLASRIYLYMEEWDKVVEHATTAMQDAQLCDLNGYSLVNANGYTPYYPLQATNNIVSQTFPETLFITGSRNTEIGSSGSMMPLGVSDDLRSIFTSDDMRPSLCYYNMSWYGLYFWAKRGTCEQATTWRTAELYLNRAEAYAEKFAAGEADAGAKAVADINTLRKNRIATASYQDYTLGTADALREFVREERRRELCFENPHRWFDLRRYGMPSLKHTWYDQTGTGLTYTLDEKDPGYALPIPQAALELNSNLEQNQLHAAREGVAGQ